MYNTTLDITQIRADFPILQRQVNGQPLLYLDNAATSQTPLPVINAISDYYKHTNANIHRGVHALSQEATDEFEGARQKIQTHFNAAHAHEIIFTSGTTHSINLVANGFTSFLEKGDELIVSELEHHANIVPWQMLCERTGAQLKVIPITANGTLDMGVYANLLNARTKVVFVNHVSNALGIVNPIEEIIQKAHAVGAAVLIDGAQATPHMVPDVKALDVEFYTTSAHKICGPTGMGMLYGKEVWLRKLPPYQGGGEMIDQVTFEKTTYADLPHKFEAGTPNISGVIGLGAAIDYVNKIGIDKISNLEDELLHYATDKITSLNKIKIFGNAQNKASVISFNINGFHPFDIGTLLDQFGIAIRTGHHCTQPLMNFFNTVSYTHLTLPTTPYV